MFTSSEMANAINSCELMKERVPGVNAVLMGTQFWQELTNRTELDEDNKSLVGLGVVTTDKIPTSHLLYSGSVTAAMETRKQINILMDEMGYDWDGVVELMKNGKKWDKEIKLWQQKANQ